MPVEVNDTPPSSLSLSDVHALAALVEGSVLDRAHPEYPAAAAVHQLAATGQPALIVRPAATADVVAALRFAQDHSLEIAVRGGGHSAAGHSTGDGVLVIDMRSLAAIEVDPVARRLRAGGGVLAGAVVAAAAEHGLTLPLGDTATVGLTGITLGGGVGYLSRQHGLTIDSLLAVELVTADGRLVRASADDEPELFWALRGGGGNFGVVTALEYRLVPAGMVYGGALLLPATREVLGALMPLATSAPREFGLIANLMPAPPAPFVPADAIGKPAIVLLGVFNGGADDGAEAWAPFRALATPIADAVGPMPYAAVYRFTEGATFPAASVTRSVFVDALDGPLADQLLAAHAASPATQAIIQLRVLGGAVADVPADATAYAHRAAPAMLAAIGTAASPADLPAVLTWAEGVREGLRGHAIGTYVNFLEMEGEARVREAYPEGTFRRLAAVKASWDPGNVFRRNQNIVPAA